MVESIDVMNEWTDILKEVADLKPPEPAEEVVSTCVSLIRDAHSAQPKAAFPTPLNATEGPTTHFCRGYLKKLGAKVKNWKRRWFVLKNTTISYHREKGAAPLGKIDLYDCLSVQQRVEEDIPYGFEIVTRNRTYLLVRNSCVHMTLWFTHYLFSQSAETPQDQTMWIEAIQTVVNTL